MEIANLKKKMKWKNCAHPFCTNIFYGSQFQRYCNEDACNELRKTSRSRKLRRDSSVENRIVPRIVVSRAISMKKKTMWLKCKAKDILGHRCNKRFSVSLEKRRSTYPKFCEEHRNAYKRERYKLSRER